jgi:hypothetical protein
MITEIQIIYLALITAFAMLAEVLYRTRSGRIAVGAALIWSVSFILHFINSFF